MNIYFNMMLNFLSLCMDKNRIGEQVKHFRRKRGMTQQELADKAGLKNKTRISQIEGGYRIPSISDTLPKICAALGIDFDVVFKELTSPPSQSTSKPR